MPVSDADYAALKAQNEALEKRVTELEQSAGGWFRAKVDSFAAYVKPFVTPLLVAAAASLAVYINSLVVGRKIDNAVTDTSNQIAPLKRIADENAANIEAVKVDASAAAVKANEAANNAMMTAQKVDDNHAELKAKVEDVKRAASQPRPIFPGKDAGKEQ